MHADHCEIGISRTYVEDVHADFGSILILDGDDVRPLRQETRKVRWCTSWVHHSISITAEFNPEPIPIHATRSPAPNFSAFNAKVNGMEAGPIFPRVGKD